MYAIVDIETTGGGIRWSRITEIAIFIHDGQRVVDRFISLVNPGMPIPQFISQLTGITDAMVADAPSWEEIAPRVEAITRNCIFVAHNVQFDYNFIRSEFARMEVPYDRDRLCTVRLSRQFIPGKESYSLGKLCDELGIAISARHRAAGDAEATVKLLELMLQQVGSQVINANLASGSPYEQLNRQLKSVRLEDVPQKSGVLHLLNEQGETLYIEGTTNLRRRAIAFLKNKAGRVGAAIKSQLADIYVEETGSALLAVLLANEQVIQKKPPFNAAKSATPPVRWKITATEGLDGFLYLSVARCEAGEHGPFSSRKLASEKLSHLLKQFFLCRRFSSLKQSNCLPASCLKACQGVEQFSEYNRRALAAISSTGSAGAGGQLIIDKGRHGSERVVIFENESGLLRWGLLEGRSSSYTQDQIAASATTLCRAANASAIMKKFLLKNPVFKILPYGPTVVAERL